MFCRNTCRWGYPGRDKQSPTEIVYKCNISVIIINGSCFPSSIFCTFHTPSRKGLFFWGKMIIFFWKYCCDVDVSWQQIQILFNDCHPHFLAVSFPISISHIINMIFIVTWCQFEWVGKTFTKYKVSFWYQIQLIGNKGGSDDIDTKVCFSALMTVEV